MKFELYNSQIFRSILAETYYLNDYKQNEFISNSLPLFESKLFFKKVNFHLPIGFNQTSDLIEQNYNIDLGGNKKFSISTIGKIKKLYSKKIGINPIIDLKKINDFENHFSKNHNQNLRKEKNKFNRENLSFSITKDEYWLEQFYDLMAFQYTKSHMMVFQPKRLFKLFLENNLCYLATVSKGGVLFAGAIFLEDDDVIHYNWGVRKNYKNLNLLTYIIANSILFFKKKKFNYFDLGATPVSDVKLLHHKMKWRPELHEIFLNSNYEVVDYLDLNNSKKFQRKIYSNFPVELNKSIMKYLIPLLIR